MPSELCKSAVRTATGPWTLQSSLFTAMDKIHERCGTRAEFGGARTNLAPVRMGTEILQLVAQLLSL